MYLSGPALINNADELSLRLFVLMSKSLSCEKVSVPFTVVFAARETGATAAFVLFNSRFRKIPFPSMLCGNVPFNEILPIPIPV